VRAAPDPEEVGAWLDRVEPALAVAATDDGAVNAALERGARERGLLVNRGDRSAADGDREPGSVAVPATVRDGPVVASVGTGGRSPALAAQLREEVEELLAGAGELAELTADLREELREEPPERRREALRAVVASDAVWKALDTPADNPRETARAVIADLSGDPT
jgi:precorrin-2 dehydrogenase/sirohydrochlorin ferrochelatase